MVVLVQLGKVSILWGGGVVSRRVRTSGKGNDWSLEHCITFTILERMLWGLVYRRAQRMNAKRNVL